MRSLYCFANLPTGRQIAVMLIAGLFAACQPAGLGNWMQQGNKPQLEIYPDRASPEPEVPFHLKIQGRWPEAVTVEEPPWPAYITEMTVRDYSRSITTEAGWQILTVDLTVEAALEGVYRIPSLPLVLHTKQGEKILRTLPLFLEVGYEAARGVTEIRALKPLQTYPTNWIWLYLLLALTVIAAAGYGVYRWRKNRLTPPLSPLQRFEHELAQLVGLEGDSLLTKKTAYKLSYLIRQLVEEETGMKALEMTGSEFRRASNSLKGASAEAIRRLALEALELELIKFRPDGRGSNTVASVAKRIQLDAKLVPAVEDRTKA